MTTPKTRKAPTPKLAYYVSDYDALEASRPELISEETVHRTVTSRGQTITDTTNTRKYVTKEAQSALYELVKLNHKLGVATPGITIGAAQGESHTSGAHTGANGVDSHANTDLKSGSVE